MGRTIGSKNRTQDQILKGQLLKLEAELKQVKQEHLRDMRIMWHKLRDRQAISRAQSSNIGRIISHLKGRSLWYIEKDKSHKLINKKHS